MNKKKIPYTALILVLFACTACGQKGPLYLPQDKTSAASTINAANKEAANPPSHEVAKTQQQATN